MENELDRQALVSWLEQEVTALTTPAKYASRVAYRRLLSKISNGEFDQPSPEREVKAMRCLSCNYTSNYDARFGKHPACQNCGAVGMLV